MEDNLLATITLKTSPVLLEHLLDIFETSSNIIYVCSGEESVIEFANQATLKAWGKDNSVLGKPIIQGVPELIGQPFPDLISRVYQSGIPYHTENDRADLKVDGILQTFYFKFTYQPLTSDAGDIWGVLCTATDITELVIAKRDVEASQENLRNMIMQAPIAMCVLKGENYIVEIANSLVTGLWGTSSQIIGQPIFDYLPGLKGQGFEQLVEEVYKTGKRLTVSEMPLESIKNDKVETAYLNFVYEPMKASDGSVTGIMAVATDVTPQVIARQEIEQSEKQLRQVSDLMPQMVWVTDQSGIHQYFNKQWYDFTQSTFEEASIIGWLQYTHPDDRMQASMKWNHSIASGMIYETEFRLRNGNNGEYRWVLGRAVPISDQDGTILKWFGTCTDIDDYKQQEQQKDDFIGIASHELKTPLTAVRASLQLMQRFVKSSANEEVLNKLVNQSARSVDKLGYLVDDLLNVTKIKEGQLFLNPNEFNLSELIEECSDYVRLEGTHRITIEGAENVKVYADSHRIEQVLINLINNAVKYAPASKEILISIAKEDKKVKVSVSDGGPGIPAEKIPMLFNRYYRVDNTGILYSGLGLGLYINSEIIKKHDGEIGVHSILGAGSTFWFTLPLAS